MSAEVPEAASAEEQKVSVHGERPRGSEGPEERLPGAGPAGRPAPAACGGARPGSAPGRLVQRAGGASAPRPSRPSSLPRLLPAGTVVPSANVVGV